MAATHVCRETYIFPLKRAVVLLDWIVWNPCIISSWYTVMCVCPWRSFPRGLSSCRVNFFFGGGGSFRVDSVLHLFLRGVFLVPVGITLSQNNILRVIQRRPNFHCCLMCTASFKMGDIYTYQVYIFSFFFLLSTCLSHSRVIGACPATT